MAPTSSSSSEDVQQLWQQLSSVEQPIKKYLWLRELLERDASAFYRLLLARTEEVLPYVYTPTVGEACQRYHELKQRDGLHTRGLYLSIDSHRGKVLERLQAWPQHQVRVVVVTDGERILGLGDLGTGGMGISEGKITLYTVAAGLDPGLCLPICLDVGTNNKKLLDDPSYPGLRRPRVTGEEYLGFMDEFMGALQRWQTHATVQFEDFGNTNAFTLLQRYGGSYCCFNDDIEGTAAITLAALLVAARASGVPLQDQRILFMGAGEAGTGIGELVARCIHRTTGLSLQEARRRCCFMDSQGLVCASRLGPNQGHGQHGGGGGTGQGLAHHKVPFAHDLPPQRDLLSAVRALQPTALIGVSTVAGAFDEPVVRAMAELNPRPIIFPLSNPTSKSECTFQQAWDWTGGRVVFASGSPFDPIAAPASAPGRPQRVVRPAQANNAYVFPALGMAAMLTRATYLGDEAFLEAALALADLADVDKALEEGQLFPPFEHILEVSAYVAARVARHLVVSGQGIRPAQCPPQADEQAELATWVAHVKANMWRPPVPFGQQPPSQQGQASGPGKAGAAAATAGSFTTRTFQSRM